MTATLFILFPSTGLRVGLWGLFFPFLCLSLLSLLLPLFLPPNTFSHRVMARSKGSGNFKLRTVQLSPQSLLNRAPQSSSLAWKIEQACSGGKDDSGATLRPGSKERPPQAMPHSHGSDPPPLTTHRGLPHFMDEETKTERE